MFYETAANDHGLSFNPFKAIVAPRPIGWISTLDANGKPNLAPYSFFNAVGDAPPMVMFSSSGYKDTVSNVEATGEFACNLVSFALRDAMNATSAPLPHGESEFERAGLEMAPCKLIKAPRVAAAPAALECKLLQVIRPTDLNGVPANSWIVLGQVVAVHIDDACLKEGRLDMTGVQHLSRLGYMDYAAVTEVFELERPKS